MAAPLSELNEDALVRILTEPRNALARQYKWMLEMDGVDLQFTDSALRAIARQAVIRGSGARGLRSILERVMLDVMYEIPGEENVKEVVVNEEAVLQGKRPLVVMGADAKSA